MEVDGRDPKKPNILVCGTPGTGKSSLAAMVAQTTGLRFVEVGAVIKENNFYESYDEKWDTHNIDDPSEDRLLDYLEVYMNEGDNIVDYHSCDLFPERWFDLVLVLRTDNCVLYDRLQSRGYSEEKISENISCEIMQVVLDSAKESYAEQIVVELPSNSEEDMRNNATRVVQWLSQVKSS